MSNDRVGFYVRHRTQISEWAALREHADKLMRDAVSTGSHETALKLMKGESGEADVDFYVRNRALIDEWDALQGLAGLALHDTLIGTARSKGGLAREGKRGWSSIVFRGVEFSDLPLDRQPEVELAWTKGHLLSSGRGFSFPRMGLAMNPSHWTKEQRAGVRDATRAVAHGFGMKNRGAWWVHWGVLPEITEAQDLHSYADACIERLREASARLYPIARDALAAVGPQLVLPPEVDNP